jgi:adenylate cyclase
MFTDMVGYTALSQRNEALALELLEEHRRILRSIFPRFNGTEIKTIGDAFLVEFQSALEAAQCALEIQRTLAKRNPDVSAERRIEIHVGDVVHREGDVYGDGVNVASRIQPVAGIGGICISVDVERQIHHALDARFEKLAPVELKNVEVPMDLFRIVLPWERETQLKPEGQKPAAARRSIPVGWLVAAVPVLALIAAWFLFGRSHAPSKPSGVAELPSKSIAVLPFENLSHDPENEFFTDGVQDEILSDLAKIADLKVISRTSVMQYKAGAQRNLREIAQQLGVAHVVEGSVQRAANKVRVIAQLIDARNDAHLWAQTYDRDLADVFAIQSEIAKAIADQLQAKLSPIEKKAIEQPPTTDLAAFDLYSRAKSLLITAAFSATGDPDLRRAIELLDEGVKRDPSFFDAYCQLAWAHETLYAVSGTDHTPARLALAEAALQAATRLRPDAGETHLAHAQYLYYGLRDYAGALAELEIARRALPNDPRVFELTGYILRRRGQQEEGLQNLQRAVELDPRNFFTLQQIALSYQGLRRYAEAIAAFDRALSIMPDNVETRAARAEFEFFWKGDTRPLHQTIDAILAQGPGAIASAADVWFACAVAERDAAAAERALVALGDNDSWNEAAIRLSRRFGEGLLARMTRDETRARTAFGAARAQQEKIVQADPGYGPTLCVLAMIDAALGRKDLALEEGRRAIALAPVKKDVANGSLVIQYFAITAAWAGEKELALQQLEAGLRAPAASLALSYGALKLLPFWDPLRGDPRFEKIVVSLAPKEAK